MHRSEVSYKIVNKILIVHVVGRNGAQKTAHEGRRTGVTPQSRQVVRAVRPNRWASWQRAWAHVCPGIRAAWRQIRRSRLEIQVAAVHSSEHADRD